MRQGRQATGEILAAVRSGDMVSPHDDISLHASPRAAPPRAICPGPQPCAARIASATGMSGEG